MLLVVLLSGLTLTVYKVYSHFEEEKHLKHQQELQSQMISKKRGGNK